MLELKTHSVNFEEAALQRSLVASEHKTLFSKRVWDVPPYPQRADNLQSASLSLTPRAGIPVTGSRSPPPKRTDFRSIGKVATSPCP